MAPESCFPLNTFQLTGPLKHLDNCVIMKFEIKKYPEEILEINEE